jgi:hypothetical protein
MDYSTDESLDQLEDAIVSITFNGLAPPVTSG